MRHESPAIRRYRAGENRQLWRIYFDATWQCIVRDDHLTAVPEFESLFS